jgi:class 3 adenylate cyclase/CheY-like chemotaxis protein
MHDPPLILVVDDNEANRDILATRLTANGYRPIQAADGEEALAATYEHRPDLLLLDVMMPKIDGIEVCRRLKSDNSLPFTPIILVTAKTDTRDVVQGLDAGADEYLTKPVDQGALVARVRSVLRMKALHDEVARQAAELTEWNRTLEARVAAQLGELERASRLKRFLAPQIAEVVSAGDERALEGHRREVSVVFCDLRGFTAFSESAEPEEVIGVLRAYHAQLGALIHEYEGTLERFTGDGVMVFFNDPLPCPEPAQKAVRMAVAMRQRFDELAAIWRRQGFELGFGVGIAHGYATLGRIGFEGRSDYAAIGSVVNLAARLCGEAEGGQIVVERKVLIAVEALAEMQELGALTLKGFHRPVPAFNIVRLKD